MIWDLSGNEREQILSSLTAVGTNEKAIGYLPLPTLRGLGISAAALTKLAAAKGLTAARVTGKHCCIKGGALYVYDHPQLSKLLASHAAVLSEYGWPADPDRFVHMVAQIWLPPSHPVTNVIRIAFADQECRAT
jgi:hypothetical protein